MYLSLHSTAKILIACVVRAVAGTRFAVLYETLAHARQPAGYRGVTSPNCRAPVPACSIKGGAR